MAVIVIPKIINLVEWERKKKAKGYLLVGNLMWKARRFHKQNNGSITLSKLGVELVRKSFKQMWINMIMVLFLMLGIPVVSRGIMNIFHPEEEASDLRNADLKTMNLDNVDLSYADLRNADLRNTNLTTTNLKYAVLRYSDLRNTNLRNADLGNTDLEHADLRNADLRNAES